MINRLLKLLQHTVVLTWNEFAKLKKYFRKAHGYIECEAKTIEHFMKKKNSLTDDACII